MAFRQSERYQQMFLPSTIEEYIAQDDAVRAYTSRRRTRFCERNSAWECWGFIRRWFREFLCRWFSIERWSNPNTWNVHKALAKAGITSVYYESPCTAYTSLTWRRYPRKFAPVLLTD
jgi:hypothetical protein